ncbi:MAG TPA: DCC1-like thiol-disulfide oxidoreductase family protein [Solirubrobacteraceae bacterium]|nr:DCC1-like thiol-disulfide oxidoreductase family protein [Solirubrobacteraceae bacterium]
MLYDRDCGLCRTITAAALALDRSHTLRPVRIQSDEARRLLTGMSEEQRLDSFHLVEWPSGRVRSAGPALAELAALLPGGAVTGRALRAAPRLSESGYRFVSGHRDAIGRRIPRRVKDAATRRVDRAEVDSS